MNNKYKDLTKLQRKMAAILRKVNGKDREAEYVELCRESRKPHPNGLQCPECGAELWDSDPMMTLTSNPPMKNIHCPKCGFTGHRVA